MKVLIAGCGNMGLNYAESLLKAKIVVKKDIIILEKIEDIYELLRKRGSI